jgi:hypothetical protein
VEAKRTIKSETTVRRRKLMRRIVSGTFVRDEGYKSSPRLTAPLSRFWRGDYDVARVHGEC